MGIEGSLSFPAGPTIGQTYDHGGKTYHWNGIAWRQVTPVVIPISEQFIVLTAAYTLVSQTAAQNLFPGGDLMLASNLTYFFECVFGMTGLSASSASFGFALSGTAVLTRQAWSADAWKNAALATPGGGTRTYNTAANVALTAADTDTTAAAAISGILRAGAGGSLMPQVSLGAAAAAVVSVDAYFRTWPVGPDTTRIG